jgi:hypothetical protein
MTITGEAWIRAAVEFELQLLGAAKTDADADADDAGR